MVLARLLLLWHAVDIVIIQLLILLTPAVIFQFFSEVLEQLVTHVVIAEQTYRWVPEGSKHNAGQIRRVREAGLQAQVWESGPAG